jgi:hypothetical protein
MGLMSATEWLAAVDDVTEPGTIGFGTARAKSGPGLRLMSNGFGILAAAQTSNRLKQQDFIERGTTSSNRQGVGGCRMVDFCADCRAILSYLFSGSMKIEFRRDCLVISRKPSNPAWRPVG